MFADYLLQFLDIAKAFNARQEALYILAVGVIVIAIFVIALRYSVILTYLNEKISLMNSFQVIITSLFAGYITIFKAGTIIVRPLMTKYFSGAPVRKSVFVVLVEQFLDAIWQVVIMLALVAFQYRIKKYLAVKYAALLAIFFGIYLLLRYRSQVITFCFKGIRLLPQKIQHKLIENNLDESNLNTLLETYLAALSDIRFYISTFSLTFIHVSITPLVMIFSAIIVNADISYSNAFFIFWVSFIIGRISGLPGGLGARDLSVVGLLKLTGIATYPAIQITILSRIAVVLPIVAIGLPLFVYHAPKLKNLYRPATVNATSEGNEQ